MSNLCSNCKYSFDTELKDGEFAKCNAPQNRKHVNTGFKSPLRWSYCSMQREKGWLGSRVLRMCGRAGRWFEARGGEAA